MNKLTIIACAVALALACQKPEPNYLPQKSTIIDLEEVDKTLPAEQIPIQLIYDNQRHVKDGKRKMPHVRSIHMLTPGPDSTLLLWDDLSTRIVQLNADGRFVKHFQGAKSGPGKFEYMHRTLLRAGDELYIPDYFNHIKVYDLGLNYLRTITNTLLEHPYFAVGRNGVLLFAPSKTGQVCRPEILQKKPGDPPPPLHPDLLHMITVHDGKSQELRNLGPVTADDTLVFSFSRRLPYHILADANSQYIWCLFDYYPAIRKYDYKGRFLEEITFVSTEIDKALQSVGYLPKPHESMGGILVFQNAHLAANGDIMVTIAQHGNVRLSGKGQVTRVVKRYKFQFDPPPVENEAPWLLAQLIGDTMYAYYWRGMIYKEVKPSLQGD